MFAPQRKKYVASWQRKSSSNLTLQPRIPRTSDTLDAYCAWTTWKLVERPTEVTSKKSSYKSGSNLHEIIQVQGSGGCILIS